MAEDHNAYSIIILCGGAGQRAGGADKPLLEIDGQPMISRIVTSLGGCGAPIFISANRNLDAYAEYGTVVADQLADFQGPLAGLLATLDRCDTPLAFVCPGDGPDVSPALLRRLHEAIMQSDVPAVSAHDGARQQNLYLMIRTRARASLQAYLSAGSRSVHGWLSQTKAASVDCADLAGTMRDVNTLAELGRDRNHNRNRKRNRNRDG